MSSVCWATYVPIFCQRYTPKSFRVAAAIYHHVPKQPQGVCGCMQALTRLCEQTECDVRSCLNTLQFLARKGRPIKLADLAGLSIGQKDISKGAFAIWQDLLQIKVCNPASTSTVVKFCHHTPVLAALLVVFPIDV